MRLTFNGMRRNPGPKETNMGVSIQINRTDANLVLINVKTILPTLLSFDLYPIGIGLRVPIVAYEKIKIIVKTKN